MKSITLLFTFLLILWGGCAHLPPPQTAETRALWQTHQLELSQVKDWYLEGRIAVTNLEDNWTANVYWQQQADQYELRFNAPLGQGGLLLIGDQNGVAMRTSKAETFYATTPEALIAKTLRLEIPLSHLYFWIRGLPVPALPIAQLFLNEEGYLYHFQQDGWRIDYQRYSNDSGITLPSKIYLENERFRVKIVISQWKLSAEKLSELSP